MSNSFLDKNFTHCNQFYMGINCFIIKLTNLTSFSQYFFVICSNLPLRSYSYLQIAIGL